MRISTLVLLVATTGSMAGLATAGSKISANQSINLPRYDSNGNQIGTRTVRAQDLWNEVDAWQNETYQRYQRTSGVELMTAQPTVFADGERHEQWTIPQEPAQQLKLKEQSEPIYTTMPVDPGPVFWPQPANTPRYRQTSMSNNFGNSGTFSVQQLANFNTSGNINSVNYSDNFDVNGYVFGGRTSLISKTTRKTSTKTSKTTRTDVKAMGTTFYVTQNGYVRNYNASVSRSYRKTKLFFVGVPVSVGGRVSGTMGANINYSTNFMSISGGINPYVNTGGRVDAGINLVFVSAGVRGTLRFINASVNAGFSAAVNASSRLLTGNLNVSQSHDLLSGKVSVFAKIFYLFGSKTFTHDIFSWNGIRSNSTLINQNIYSQL
ncbi:hypothetical protein [Pseudobacteriovorax antillogorgiicola]|uniref:hypothetical protein n=1 Tax=Pseudobacteriovorax antillogorgiicola TaxID=1513793 RepID=UPI001049F8A1|nr:hypothetical protein [Pseudobacteriovorax antillogorgiicola]